ncbi:hypothetical protein FRC03_011728 [Tulasnella sp. 419]|nr:hypothetical protein FRC03_011728 [Tulasnella sp. 419]
MGSGSRIQPGTYLIQSVASSKYLNVVRHNPGDEPVICIWRVFNSPSQKWTISASDNGYLIKNVATELYLSSESDPACNIRAIMSGRPIEFIFEPKNDSQFEIKVASNRSLGLDVNGGNSTDGNHLILYNVAGHPNQCYTLKRVDDPPPSYGRQSYVGPVPPGIYWIGQPSENGGPGVAGKAPTTSGLSASTTTPLTEGKVIPVHLSAAEDGPLQSQIWSFECGTRGYRIRHLDTNTYLHLVNREPVLEYTGSIGQVAFTEWQLERKHGDILPAYHIRPLVDLGLLIGVTKGDTFNRLRAKGLLQFGWEMVWSWVYLEWRLEPADENILDRFQPVQ